MRHLPGMVERFGPRISGWVAFNPESGRDVVIKVNGREVARTVACRPVRYNGEICDYGFVRMLGGLFEYVGKDDKISVEYNRVKLPIIGQGLVYVHSEDKESRIGDLQRRMRRGFVFDKKGRLARQLRRQSQDAFFNEFAKIRDQVLAKFGCELFVIYGTLLGCVREGNFIVQDNDLDFTYISKFSDPADVKAEFLAIIEFLIDLGFSGLLTRYSFNVKAPLNFDIIFSWFNPEGQYQLGFGWHGPEILRSDNFFRMEERKLGEQVVRVPANAEAILAQIYGTNWRVPDPGFSHYSTTRKQDSRYVISYDEQRPLYWKQFHKYNDIAEKSGFAAWLLPQLPRHSLIADIGCGSGQDAVFFAENGHRVRGADASAHAILRATEAAQGRKLPDCAFSVLELTDGEARRAFCQGLRADAHGADIVIYLRFLLHSTREDIENALLDSLTEELDCFILAAEFRTLADRELPKVHAPHYTRYIDPNAMVDKLKRYGMKIDSVEEGSGLSIYKTLRGRKEVIEDPILCRIVARR